AFSLALHFLFRHDILTYPLMKWRCLMGANAKLSPRKGKNGKPPKKQKGEHTPKAVRRKRKQIKHLRHKLTNK
ncbi:MAG: hypothetical protein ABEI13_00115, partial [Candidatus Paceibacteria bacterium]